MVDGVVSEDGWVVHCNEFSPVVNSMGITNSSMSSTFFTYGMARLNIQLLLLFCVTQAAHFFLKRVGFIKLASQMVAGIILGPLILGRTRLLREVIFPIADQRNLRTLGVLGYVLFIFVSGVKMDITMVKRTGRKTLVLGLACCVPPLLLCNAIQMYFNRYLQPIEGEENFNTIMLVILSLRSFPVIASLLGELKILNSELGRLSLSAALIAELFSDCCQLIYRTYLTYINKDTWEAVNEVCRYIGFVAFIVLIYRPAMFWIIKRTPQGRPVKEKYTNLVIMFFIAFVVICFLYLKFFISGCFILGLAIPSGPPLGSAIEQKLENFGIYFLMPLQATISAMKLDFAEFSFQSNPIKFGLTIIVITTPLVLLLCYAIARYCKMPHGDAIAVTLILISKGIFELASIGTLRDEWSINGGIFDLIFLNILATVIIIPAAIRYFYDPSKKYGGYQKRNILHMKHNDQMKVVSIIHRPDNVRASINLLDAFGPSSDSPIIINVLHLMEQIGQATPIFISHQMQTRTVTNYSYSGDVIRSFSQYEKSCQPGTVDVNIFTAVSPASLMHEDVCRLALDKLANFTILPFHQKRSIHGVIDAEFTTIRALNNTILDRAPSSVGIFIDNGGFENSASGKDVYNVGMVFVGGKDDREALSLAKWLAKDSRVSLSLLHVIADDEEDQISKDWGKILDKEVLKEFVMTMRNNDNVSFAEKVVKDGPETASVIQCMLEDNHNIDLFIVGRNFKVECTHTAGLGGEWSDYPELGALGDLLASLEFNEKASVLVVQQQRIVESKAY